MADGAAAVGVRGLTKRLGTREVLAGVDLELTPGSLTAVLGPSGCGKTTLLRLLAGFAMPDAGRVYVAGRDVTDVPAHRRRIGLLPQEGALFPYLSAAGNVAFGVGRGGRRGAPRSAAAEVAHWLDVVGLAGYGDARPAELSGGQQQRVALARALAARPRVMLLDEPFAALDAGLRARVREDIAGILAASGTTAVLVTHDQDEALSLADSVAVLLDGTVVVHGSPARVYGRPPTLAAARFVGATVELPGRCAAGVVTSALGAHPVTGVRDGPVTAVVRPESLRLADDGVPAGVVGVRFLGATATVELMLADGCTVTVRVDAAQLPEVGAATGIRVTGPVLAYPRPPGSPPRR